MSVVRFIPTRRREPEDHTVKIETSDIKQTLVGEAYYRERKLLPSGAELHLTPEDVSSTVIATSTQSLTDTLPYEFNLGYVEEDTVRQQLRTEQPVARFKVMYFN